MKTELIQTEYDNYMVDRLGNVYSKNYNREKRLKMLKPVDTQGYLYVGICINGTLKRKMVHRLIAKVFIPNPKNKPCINHKNGIKNDNRVENLEWVTISENDKHAYKIGLKKINQNQRMASKRNVKLASIKNRKHSDEMAAQARALYIPRDPKFCFRGLADRFGASQMSIWQMVNRKGVYKKENK